MNNEEINTELQLATEEPLAQSKPSPFACNTCGQGFKNMNAVRMHKVRVHTEAGRQGALKGARNSHHVRVDNFRNREEHLAHRREYQKKLRERYKATGRDSRGYPRKKNQPQWSPEQRAKFMRTVKRKAAEKLQPRGKKQIRYVYPEPETEETSPLELLAEKVTKPIHRLRHCPYCGENIQRHLALES